MRNKISWVLGVATFLILVSMILAFGQDAPASSLPPAPVATAPAPLEPEAQWLWGEVVSADFQKNELLIKYLDYDTDQEKQITICADDKTTYENIKTILEIKPTDIVSVDYIIGADGKNIARNISVEKAEEGAQEPVSSVPEVAPETSPTANQTPATTAPQQ